MDGDRFDAMARAWGAARTRRGALRLLAAGGLGALLARLAPSGVGAQEAQAVCGLVGEPCTVNGRCCRGGVCRAGACACPPKLAACNGRCRDLRANENHCGACNTPCGSGETCCRRRCVDLQTDEANCGECGNACGACRVCQGGACVPGPAGADCGAGGVCLENASCADRCGDSDPCPVGCSCTGPDPVVCLAAGEGGCGNPPCQTTADCAEGFRCQPASCSEVGGRCARLCGA